MLGNILYQEDLLFCYQTHGFITIDETFNYQTLKSKPFPSLNDFYPYRPDHTYLYSGTRNFKSSEALKVFNQRLKLFLACFRYTFVVLKSIPEIVAKYNNHCLLMKRMIMSKVLASWLPLEDECLFLLIKQLYLSCFLLFHFSLSRVVSVNLQFFNQKYSHVQSLRANVELKFQIFANLSAKILTGNAKSPKRHVI